MSKQQTNLAVVTEESALSPAREQLQRAIAAKASAQQAQENIMRQHQTIEAKINASAEIRAKIDAMQSEHTTLLADAMLNGTTPPSLPHVAEVARLESELPAADAVAKAGRAALANLNQQLTTAQKSVATAIEAIRGAADQVLVESAAAMARELEQTERRAAQLRGELIALQRHLQLEGFRKRQVGEAQMAVGRLMPKGPLEMMPQSIELAVSKWSELASQLFTNENAELEQTR